MIAALLAAASVFQATQWTPRTVQLRGCAECAGEADDVCEVRAGVHSAPLDEPRMKAGRVRLVRSKAEPECAVQAKALAKSPVELAAVRAAASAPPAALIEKAIGAMHGWPVSLARRKSVEAPPRAERSALRLSVVCWPSDEGWPHTALSAANRCELWLLPQDVTGVSLLLTEPFAYGDARFGRAFDSSVPLEELFAPPPPAPAPAPASSRCGDAARARTATLDRFDQWDAQIRKAGASSLDRAALAVDATLWAGHCQELDVLRAALEQQLGCELAVAGKCGP